MIEMTLRDAISHNMDLKPIPTYYFPRSWGDVTQIKMFFLI